jgi:hypothetical protein
MSEQPVHLTQKRLRSPRSAAIAGLVFSVLMGAIIILIQGSFPTDPTDISGDWLEKNEDIVTLAIGFVPIAGIAFLWFMGVTRDLLGHLEDQFFSTIFTGSGLLFLGMIFIWAAIGGTLLYGYSVNPGLLIEGGFYMIGRRLMVEIITVFAMSMAGTYVFSSGSIWLRTGVVPRWLAILTWAVAVVLWLSAIFGWWVQLIFPIWVFLISIYILTVSRDSKAVT